MSRREIIKTLLSLLADRGARQRLSDGSTALSDAVQCATLARNAGATPELTSAALLHGIGSLLDDEANEGRPEWTGARYLARWYPPAVTDPIRLHVAARRYLCATSPAYLERLPGPARLDVQVRGGVMNRDEMVAFKSEPHFADALDLRRWKDQTDRVAVRSPPITDFAGELLKAWRPALAEHS